MGWKRTSLVRVALGIVVPRSERLETVSRTSPPLMEQRKGLFAKSHTSSGKERKKGNSEGKPALRLEDHHQVASSRLPGHPVDHDLSVDMQLTLRSEQKVGYERP